MNKIVYANEEASTIEEYCILDKSSKLVGYINKTTDITYIFGLSVWLDKIIILESSSGVCMFSMPKQKKVKAVS